MGTLISHCGLCPGHDGHPPQHPSPSHSSESLVPCFPPASSPELSCRIPFKHQSLNPGCPGRGQPWLSRSGLPVTLAIAKSPHSLSVGTPYAADSLQPPALTPPSFPSWRLFSSTYSRSCCLFDSEFPASPARQSHSLDRSPRERGTRDLLPSSASLGHYFPFWGLSLRLITAELLLSGQVSFPFFLMLTHFPSLLGVTSLRKVAFWLRL